MLYREEWRLDKILDIIEEYMICINTHGIPPPPTESCSLNEFVADVSDSSSSDDNENDAAITPKSPDSTN